MPDPWSPAGPAPSGAPPPAAAPSGRRRPGRWAYVLGGLLVTVSVVGAVAVLAVGFARAIDVRPLPASGTGVVLEEAGTEIGLYRETRGAAVPPGSSCRATATDGRPLPVPAPTGSVTITRGATTYEAVGRLRLPADGRARIDCGSASRGAVGPAPDVFGAVGLAFATIGAGIVGSLLGLAVLLTTFLLRRRTPRG